MARTPLANSLEELVASLAAQRGLTRRRFLRNAGVAGLAATSFSRLVEKASGAAGPRIVIVGGGLAGLTAGYRLNQAGYSVELHEASSRLGGRCWTIRGAFAEGQLGEHGGELIDQGHTAIRHLASELGLKLENLLQGEASGTKPTYYFDGSHYTHAQATDDIKQIWQKLHSDVSAASYPTLFDSFTKRGYELDHMSIVDWINESVPGGRITDACVPVAISDERAELSATVPRSSPSPSGWIAWRLTRWQLSPPGLARPMVASMPCRATPLAAWELRIISAGIGSRRLACPSSMCRAVRFSPTTSWRRSFICSASSRGSPR